MAVIISVVVTAVVMMVAWISATMSQSTGSFAKQSRAFCVAEGALQRAYWRYRQNTAWRAPAGAPMTGTSVIDGVSYPYSVTAVGNNNQPILVTSTATNAAGTVLAQVHVTLFRLAPAAIGVGGGTFSTTSQLNVTGDLSLSGGFTASGTCNVTGNVDTSGSIPGSISVTGTETANDATLTVPSVTAIYNSLLPGAYTIAGPNITSLDFTSHPVLLVNGNASLNISTITGSGTLVVNGNVSTGGNLGTVGSPATFHLVTNGTVTANQNWYQTGSLYAAGLVTFNNQTALTGVLLTNGGAIMNNHHSFTFANPPSFDPRAKPAVSGYGGPNP
jgi:hypothetical protein